MPRRSATRSFSVEGVHIRKRKRRFLRIGVTGGIGGGKSVVCEMFKKLGVPVLSADEIARHVSETNAEVVRRIAQEFGPEFYTKEGLLDRKRMASVVFSDRKQKEKLNAIVHPFVIRRINEEMELIKRRTGAPFVIHEAALIYEAGADKDLDYVVVVDAEEEIRIRRVMKRDGVSREEVLQRINSQMPAESKRKLADFLILNNGNLKALEEKVKFLYHLFSKMAATSS